MALPKYVPSTNFKLIALQNIRVEEALFSKGASVKWNKHPTQFNPKKKKRRKLKSVIVHGDDTDILLCSHFHKQFLFEANLNLLASTSTPDAAQYHFE